MRRPRSSSAGPPRETARNGRGRPAALSCPGPRISAGVSPTTWPPPSHRCGRRPFFRQGALSSWRETGRDAGCARQVRCRCFRDHSVAEAVSNHTDRRRPADTGRHEAAALFTTEPSRPRNRQCGSRPAITTGKVAVADKASEKRSRRSHRGSDGSIRTIYDRVCQQALVNRLESIFQPIFDDANFGYRRGRSTKDALRKV
jgi:hypothetical protein